MGVEEKVIRGRGEGDDGDPKFALVFRRSGDGVGGDKTAIECSEIVEVVGSGVSVS